MAFKMKGFPLRNVETRQDATAVDDPIKPEIVRIDDRGLIEEKDEGVTTLTGGGLAEKRATKDTLRKGGKVLRELKGRSEAGKDFDRAFAAASKEGKETFTWRGKSYTTEKA